MTDPGNRLARVEADARELRKRHIDSFTCAKVIDLCPDCSVAEDILWLVADALNAD